MEQIDGLRYSNCCPHAHFVAIVTNILFAKRLKNKLNIASKFGSFLLLLVHILLDDATPALFIFSICHEYLIF